MKELITITIISIILFSSCEMPEPKHTIRKDTYDNGSFAIQEIDSCEYVVAIVQGGRSITHKGNCKFCLIRNKK